MLLTAFTLCVLVYCLLLGRACGMHSRSSPARCDMQSEVGNGICKVANAE